MFYRWGWMPIYTPFNFLSLLSSCLRLLARSGTRDISHPFPFVFSPFHNPAGFAPAPLPTYCPLIAGPLTFSVEARIQVLGRSRAIFEPCPFVFTSMKTSYTLSLQPCYFLAKCSCGGSAVITILPPESVHTTARP